jgi:hypothetical protein
VFIRDRQCHRNGRICPVSGQASRGRLTKPRVCEGIVRPGWEKAIWKPNQPKKKYNPKKRVGDGRPSAPREDDGMRNRIVLAALVLATGPGQTADPPADKTGLKVGEKAPAFALKDQAGKERTLAEFVKAGKVALVFYRSAAW